MARWYVTQTKARQEGVAQENLERQGYTTYCPRITRMCPSTRELRPWMP